MPLLGIKKLDLKKLITATVVLWLVGTVFTFLTCGSTFQWVYTLPPNIWQKAEVLMSPDSMITSNLWGIFRSLIFVTIWALIGKGIPGKSLRQGINYGLIVWAVGTLSGMATLPLYMTINTAVVVYWILQALVLNVINGALTARIYKI